MLLKRSTCPPDRTTKGSMGRTHAHVFVFLWARYPCISGQLGEAIKEVLQEPLFRSQVDKFVPESLGSQLENSLSARVGHDQKVYFGEALKEVLPTTQWPSKEILTEIWSCCRLIRCLCTEQLLISARKMNGSVCDAHCAACPKILKSSCVKRHGWTHVLRPARHGSQRGIPLEIPTCPADHTHTVHPDCPEP